MSELTRALVEMGTFSTGDLVKDVRLVVAEWAAETMHFDCDPGDRSKIALDITEMPGIAEALGIVKDLAAFTNNELMQAGWEVCPLCNHRPDGSAVFTDVDEHAPSCPYRRAVELMEGS